MALEEPSAGAALEGPFAEGPFVEALELFVEVLTTTERGVSAGERFYDHLCSAICRLARMRRAVIFRYDPASRRVRAAGAYGLDISQFAGAHISVDTAPIAARALKADRVIEASGDLRAQFPPEYAAMVEGPRRLACAPMAAAGRAVGVILADRGLDTPPFDAAERQLLWTLGKTAALATVARAVATEAENAKQLQQRIDLAREVHEGVIQRLFGVSMVLDGDGELPADVRVRCAAETQSALSELRSALQRPLGRAPQATETTLSEEVQRLSRAHPELGITLNGGGGAGGEVPAALEPVAQSVLIEAVRNARKHSNPTSVQVSTRLADGAFVLEVVNDGVRGNSGEPGMGLRLASFEAVQSGGVLEFGSTEAGGSDSWQVRLVVPHDG